MWLARHGITPEEMEEVLADEAWVMAIEREPAPRPEPEESAESTAGSPAPTSSAPGPDARAEPSVAHLPVSGRYAPAAYFPYAARWTEAQMREHLDYAAAYERRTGYAFPRPWRTPEDSRGWRVVARGKKWPGRAREKPF